MSILDQNPSEGATVNAPEQQNEALRFLELLGKDPSTARFRFFPHKDNPRKKLIGARTQVGFDAQKFEKHQAEGRNVYVVIGEGGDTDKSISGIGAQFNEWDDKPLEWQRSACERFGLPEPSLQNESGGKSLHNYWVLDQPVAPAKWQEAQQRLSSYLGSDASLKNPSRVMRLPGFAYIGAEGLPTGQCRIVSASAKRYTLEEVLANVPELPAEPAKPPKPAGAMRVGARSMDEVRAALKCIPAREAGTNTYPGYRNALWGLIRAVEEAGGTRDQAIKMMQEHSPDGWDPEQVGGYSFKQVTSGSFWLYAKNNGYQLSLTGSSSIRPDQPQCSYSELLNSMLVATIQGDEDELMELRAETIARFRRTDAQIEAALFKLHTRVELGVGRRQEPESLDLLRISGMDWLIEGFVPDKDQTMLWGDAGSGKTTAALAMSNAILQGAGLLDHTHHSRCGKVLFIASDSGASPLYAAMQDMGIADMSEVQQGPNQRLFVWASDADQGMQAWSADLRGCIRLLEFVKRHQIDFVIIDSCKAVCSGAGLDYANNLLVTSLLTYFKEVICPWTAVAWLNHDGVARGAHAGAKAWREIPAMVHRILREERKDGAMINNRRHWRVTKSRMGPGREFYYELNQGDLRLCPNQEMVGNCLARIVDVLWGALHLQGQESLSKDELVDRVCLCGGPSRKTLDNTLSTASRSKHPEICRVSGKRGYYKLAPRVVDALKGHTTNGKEEGKNSISHSDLLSSHQVPAGSSPIQSAPPATSHRKMTGKG
jgi:hypothetical protein